MTFRSYRALIAVSALASAWAAACSSDSNDFNYPATTGAINGTPVNADGPAELIPAGGAGGAPAQAAGSGGMPMAGSGGMSMAGSGGVPMAGSGGVPMGTAGSPMVGAAGAALDAEPCDAVQEVFLVSCAGGGCHSGGAPGTFAVANFDPEDIRDVNGPLASSCGPFINSADPQNSSILTKLLDPVCAGTPMPIGPALSPAQIDCVSDWLDQFAE